MDLFMSNICRTCANSEENVVKIVNTFIGCDTSTVPITHILNLLSDIQITDECPDNICSKCIEKAVLVYKFKVQCDEATKILVALKKKIANPILEVKLESSDINESIAQAEPTANDVSNNNVAETGVIDSAKKPKRKLTKRARQAKSSEIDCLLFCHQCNKSFKNKYVLSAHLKRHQYNGHFVCNVCGKGFNSKSCLTRHTRVHTGEKKYDCGICHKKFASSNNLNLHSRTHSGIKPYLCTTCGKSFSHPTGLTYHTRTHTKEKPYTCEVCGKSFAIQCHMARHLKTHSGERPFPCKQCDKAFIKKFDLQRHEAVHLGLKPFVCSVCNKAFLRKLLLNYHMMIHTKERPFVCKICGKGFIRRYYLKHHLTRRHETGNYEVIENNG